MKALTVRQPWASLIAEGVKTVEWRSRQTHYRGPIAIHAGAVQLHHGKFYFAARYARMAGKLSREQEQTFRALDVPFGAVVATAELIDCVPANPKEWTGSTGGPWTGHVMRGDGAEAKLLWSDSRRRFLFDWDEQSRYSNLNTEKWGWLLANVRKLDEPVPAKGRQGLWDWEADR